MKKKSQNTDDSKVQDVFSKMSRHMGCDQISDMLQIDPKLKKNACAEWLVENAYNQAGHLSEELNDQEIALLEKLLLQEAKAVASSAL